MANERVVLLFPSSCEVHDSTEIRPLSDCCRGLEVTDTMLCLRGASSSATGRFLPRCHLMVYCHVLPIWCSWNKINQGGFRLFYSLYLLLSHSWCMQLQCKWPLLHSERNYFTGVNRLTPQTELLHTSKNEVKVIPSLPARSWKSSISTRCFTPRLQAVPSNFSQWREGNNHCFKTFC